MTDPSFEKTHHLKTSDAPSGGNGTVSVEHHPPANENGGPDVADRGRQRHRGGHSREVCPAFVDGNDALPKCPPAARSCQEPGGGADAAGGLVGAHGDSGDGPVEENLSPQQNLKRSNSGQIWGPDLRKVKKNRRGRAKKKRRWKPYCQLSWEEKKEVDERETARASRLREEMFAKGLPVAPYNTTQFLMDEHDREEPDLNTETGPAQRRMMLGGPGGRMEDTASEDDVMDNDEDDDSGGGSDGIGRPGNAGGDFLQRDFSETYEKYHVESLQNMTKQELVQEYLELEKCMSRLEEENNRLRCSVMVDPTALVDSPGRPPPQNQQVDPSHHHHHTQSQPAEPAQPADPARLRDLETELERLRVQNLELLNRLNKEPQIVSSSSP